MKRMREEANHWGETSQVQAVMYEEAGMGKRIWDDISGKDPALPYNPDTDRYPAAVVKPDNFGGTKLLALVGLRLKDPRGRLENTFLELEAGAPFYQDLNGPQPSEDWRFSASFVLSF